jgi:hypothetical protein
VERVGDGAPGARATGGCNSTPLSSDEERSGGVKQLVGHGRADQRHEQAAAGSGRWRQGQMMSGSKSPGHPVHSRSLWRGKKSSVLLGKKTSLSLQEAYCLSLSLLLFFPRKTFSSFAVLFFCHLLVKRSWSQGPSRLFYFSARASRMTRIDRRAWCGF